MSTLKKDYHFDLPEELIAHRPTEQRDHCRLLRLGKQNGEVNHHSFPEIETLLPENGVIVLNDTRVIHARIPVQRDSGGKGEVLIEKKLENGLFEAIAKPSKRLKEGEMVQCMKSKEHKIKLHKYCGDGVWHVEILPEINWPEQMPLLGELPLPPYIERKEGMLPSDEEEYQTVFSKQLGSVAAPTASLHFTDELLKRIENRGIEIVKLTHHVGLGTFYPIRVDDLKEHQMHEERFSISKETSQKIFNAKRDGRPIVAVGTTAVRALESGAESILKGEAIQDQTQLFIYPPYQYKVVDGLITNFHLPESSLIMLVSAFSSRENVLNAYQKAVQEKYRFFSYGDAMFIY